MKEKNSSTNLPIPISKQSLTNVKHFAIKSGKMLGSCLSFTGFSALFMGSIVVAPLLTLPIGVGLAFSAQKLLNNTLYQSHKDLTFIVHRFGKNRTIAQDVLRPDISKELSKLDSLEKVGFMQLQALVGLSKFDHTDKKGNPITYRTLSHGITRKTFKTLEKLGYLNQYQETFKKDSHLILPKLAFGNMGALKDTVSMYDINFQLGGQPFDITNPKLQKAFPLVFHSQKGILANHYGIIPNLDGSLSIDYAPSIPFIRKEDKEKEMFQEKLQKDTPTQEQQYHTSEEFVKAYNQSNKYPNLEAENSK